ncbi:MAG TPA: SDR family oxidoreductase [Polyangiaceae bacterium]|jgi:short-subunit dehydrogenase|nr:SDR family oxidoreductase [Polyangiaceae bacterium]
MDIFVTGATSGIGRDAAKAFAEKGHRVFAAGRNEQALRELEAEHGIVGVVLDVTKQESIDAAFELVSEKTGGRGVDVLVNNAGYATAGAIVDMDEAVLRAQFDTNVFGLVAMTKKFAEPMLVRRSGRVVNVGSVSGRIPAPLLGAYHATKYALEALNDAMRMEMKAFGVDVVMVEPGTIKTGFAKRTMSEASAMKTSATRSRFAPAYAEMDAIESKFASLASSTKHTTRALLHAALARRPCTRYVAPWRFWAVIALVQLAPTRLLDAIARATFGLTRAKLDA